MGESPGKVFPHQKIRDFAPASMKNCQKLGFFVEKTDFSSKNQIFREKIRFSFKKSDFSAKKQIFRKKTDFPQKI